ncbi:hypothetical protein F2Q70_00017335 [Brassica cretica]|uniref:Uncharacterized protein n=1 Tax=Brassica cretica TaxID=69181 RepID=A0A8S9HZ05_BRACR|nr:hypothetical protein F2Q70_00017335 [Brassica cretica]
MYMSKALHLAVPKHQRPLIWTEEAAGFHKRVKMIHDPVKIVVPCAVFEVESPIPPDASMQFNSYIEVLDDHQQITLKIPKWINMSTMLHLLRMFEGTKADLQPN